MLIVLLLQVRHKFLFLMIDKCIKTHSMVKVQNSILIELYTLVNFGVCVCVCV